MYEKLYEIGMMQNTGGNWKWLIADPIILPDIIASVYSLTEKSNVHTLKRHQLYLTCMLLISPGSTNYFVYIEHTCI